jgi:hypothetical protein
MEQPEATHAAKAALFRTVLIDCRVSAKFRERQIWAGRPAGKARSFFKSATKAPCGKMEKSERIQALILSAGGDILFDRLSRKTFQLLHIRPIR